ncbi:multicopper oxidase family protein [Microlunatus flavus]|uniref:Multicopper oxidase with three cupredoxin domains (Includes cell division protein FtsP and spore coat protein CotA) n=1 Tax=Microlunatus flavus TaxID=1036181 RepID=A0A1H9J7W4_9ACTN|nr:multicopper oxidase domain-containing protein [Microlunatus flavus]SEQ82893.1 Multicopper oxidase with three cupredoxin domains (includes cell division protein FtsP and spore coat protein CotA) [Microlunatus flavus]
MNVTRRDALKLGGLAAVGTAAFGLPLGRSVSGGTPSLLASKNFPPRYTNAFRPLEKLVPTVTYDADGPIHNYDIWAKPGLAGIVPGLQTPVLGYGGVVPAKRIDVDQGTRITMTMHNRLPATHPVFGTPVSISTHLHGSASLPQYDGYASDLTESQQKKVYHYPNFQPARTLWYHDHGVHYTAQNAYSGLASQYHLHDPDERRLLPQGEFDVALTLSDMMFQANGSQLYDDRSHSGLWGDVILVNGTPWPVMKVKKRVYRFRLLNASLSRSYRPTLSTGDPVYMVATDGGLMPAVVPVSEWRHGSAERYEFLVDFRKYATGQRVELKNLSNPNNRDFDFTGKIMAFDVVGDSFDKTDPTWDRPKPVMARPNGDPLASKEVMGLTETKDMKVVTIRVQRDDTTNEWNLNGETWHDVVDSEYKKVLASPDLGETQVWEIQNNSGGWFHPVHIHLIDFKILSRNGRAPFAYEQGPKDVVYVGEGEKVRLIMKFGPHRGKYMVHCHNLPHEDHDMMHQFSVGLKSDDVDDNDPIHADPAVDDDSPTGA